MESLTSNICCMCHYPIKTQIFKGTGICSENCRKDRDDDHEAWRATDRPKKTVSRDLSDMGYPR